MSIDSPVFLYRFYQGECGKVGLFLKIRSESASTGEIGFLPYDFNRQWRFCMSKRGFQAMERERKVNLREIPPKRIKSVNVL